MDKKYTMRNIIISIFVVLWIVLFHYESTRHFFLSPLAKKHFDINLPKTKFLFPPAGWIMFFRVGPSFGHAEIYGLKNQEMLRIDPHEIIETRTIGYDNIHRNILTSVVDRRKGPRFCGFLNRKFPYFDGFVISYVQYPDVIDNPQHRVQQMVYQCQ